MRPLIKGNQQQNQGQSNGGQGASPLPANTLQQKNQQISQNQQQNQLQNQLSQQQQAGGNSKYQDMKRIEDYTFCLSDMVGKGASGTVYLGENIVTKEIVAIKVIDLHQVKDEYTWGLICSEIDFMKKLKCDNVVRLIDVFQTQNNAYIVTELCEDGDLVDYMKRNVNKIRQNQAVKIITDILRGLQELAKHGIIHRDLKPANILIAKKDTFKITDFGFARMVEKNDYLMTSLVGTPLYMSPQILKRQMYTSKCDVWSIGLIFYELIYGQTPWPSNSVIDLVNNMFTNPLKFPTTGQAGDIILEGVKDFIRSCLKFEENDRLGWDEVYKHILFKDALYTTQKNNNIASINGLSNQSTFLDERGSQVKSPSHQRDSQNKKGSFSTSFQTSFMTTMTNAGASNATKSGNSKGSNNQNQNTTSNKQNNQSNNQKNQKGYHSSNQNQSNAKSNIQVQGTQQTTSNMNGQSTITNNTANFNSTGNTTINNTNNNVTITSTSSNSSNNNINNNNCNMNSNSSQTNIQQNTQLGGNYTNMTVINLNQQQNNQNQVPKLYSKQNSRQNTPSLQNKQLSQPITQTGAINTQEGKLCENSSQSTPRQQPAKVNYTQSMMKQISNQQSNGVTSTGSFICPSSQPQNLGNSGNNSNLPNNGLQLQNIPNNRQSNIVSPTIKDKRPATNGNGLFAYNQNSSSFLQQYQLQGQSQNKLETIRQQYKKQVSDKKSTDFIYIQGSNHNLTSETSMNSHFNPANNHSAVCSGSSDRGINEKGITGVASSQSSAPFNFIHKRQKSAREVGGNYNQTNFYIPLASPTKNSSQTDKYRILTEPNQINDFKETYSPDKHSMILGANRESNLQNQNQSQQNQYNSSSPLSTEPSQNPVPTVLITLGSMNQLPNVSQNNNSEQLQSPPKITSGHMLNFSNDQSVDQESPMNLNNQFNQAGKMGFGLINLESTNIGTPDKNIAIHIKPGFYQQKGKNNNRSITPTMTTSAHKTISPNTSNNTPKMQNTDNINSLANSKKALSNFNKFATAVYNSDERGSKLIPSNNSNNNQGMASTQSSNSKRIKLNNRQSQHNQQQQFIGSTSSSNIQQKLSQSKRNLNNDIVNNSSKNFDLFKTADQILTYGSMCGNEDDSQYQTGSPKNAGKRGSAQQFTSSFIQNANNKPHNYIQLTLNSASNSGPARSNQGQYQSEKKNSPHIQANSQSPSNKITGQNNTSKQNFPSHQYKSYDFSSHTSQNPLSSGSFIGQLNGSGMSSQPVPRNSSIIPSGNVISKDIKFEESIDGKQDISDRSPTNILNNPIINLNRRDLSNSQKQNITQVNLNYPLMINTKQQTASSSYIGSPATNSSNFFSQLYNQELAAFNYTGSTQGVNQQNDKQTTNQAISENRNQIMSENNVQNISQGSNSQATAGINNQLISGNIQTGTKPIIPIDLKKTQQEFYSPQVKNQKFIFDGSNQTQQQHCNTTTNQSQIGLSSAILQNSQFKSIQKTQDFSSYQNNIINYMQQDGNSSIDILNNYQNYCKFLFNLVRIINNSNFDKNHFSQSNFIIEKVTFILLKNCMMKLTILNEKMFGLGENIFNLSDWSSFKTTSKFTELQTSFFLMSTEIQSSFDQEYSKGSSQSKYQQQISQDYSFNQLFNKDFTDDVRFYSMVPTLVKQFITILNQKLSQNPVSSLQNPNPIITDKNDIVILALIEDFIEYYDMLKTNLINMDSFHQQVFIKFNQFLQKCNNAYNYLTLCSKTSDSILVANIQQKIKEFLL